MLRLETELSRVCVVNLVLDLTIVVEEWTVSALILHSFLSDAPTEEVLETCTLVAELDSLLSSYLVHSVTRLSRSLSTCTDHVHVLVSLTLVACCKVSLSGAKENLSVTHPLSVRVVYEVRTGSWNLLSSDSGLPHEVTLVDDSVTLLNVDTHVNHLLPSLHSSVETVTVNTLYCYEIVVEVLLWAKEAPAETCKTCIWTAVVNELVSTVVSHEVEHCEVVPNVVRV